nr:THO complex subunit 5B-like [Ipomoea trifida]
MDGVLLSYRRKPRNRLSLPVSPPPAPTASSSHRRPIPWTPLFSRMRVVEACGVDGERRASGRNPAKELHRGPRSFGVALFQVACNLSISIYCNLSVSASTAPVRAARIQMGFLGPVRAGVVEVIALNSSQAAEGELYIDDGRSFDFKEGAYIHRRFIFSAGTLTSLNLTPSSGSEILPERKPEKSPYEVLRQSKASVVSKMLSLKKEGKQKSELRELATQIFLNFVTLRQANRSILLEEDRIKAETERTFVDSSKLDEDVPDEEDDGQRRRKRPRKVPSKESLDHSGIYQAHPLKVILHVHDDETPYSTPTKLVTLKFEYLMKLNVVCVGVDGSQEDMGNDILCNLFLDDTGLELPHQAAKMIGNSVEFDGTRTLRPYNWAQHLAGIDFLPEVSPLLGGSESSNEETAKQSTLISVLACKSVPWTSHNPRCSLHGWSSLGSACNEASSVPAVDAEKVQGPDVSMEVRSDTSKEEVENTREDGELPSLTLATAGVNDATPAPTRGTNSDHSRKLGFISKCVISPLNKGKSPSFKKHEEDVDLIMESDSQPAQVEQDTDNMPGSTVPYVDDKSWADCRVEDYILVLTRKTHDGEKTMRLEAQALFHETHHQNSTSQVSQKTPPEQHITSFNH